MLDGRARPVVVHVGAIHVEEQVAQLLPHVALRPVGSVEPQVHLRLVERDVVGGFLRRVDLLEERVVFRPVRLTAWSGIDEHQLRHPLRVVEREVERKRSAHRAADQVHRLELERVDEGQEVGARVPRRRREIRLAEPAHVGPDHVEVLRELADLRLPHPRVRDAGVQEHDRHAFTGPLVVDARAVERRLHQVSAESSALNFSSVSSSSRAGSESGMTPTPA